MYIYVFHFTHLSLRRNDVNLYSKHKTVFSFLISHKNYKYFFKIKDEEQNVSKRERERESVCV